MILNRKKIATEAAAGSPEARMLIAAMDRYDLAIHAYRRGGPIPVSIEDAAARRATIAAWALAASVNGVSD